MPALLRLLPALLAASFAASCGSASRPPAARQTQFLEPPSTEVSKAWPHFDTGWFPKVSRAEIIETALAYMNHEWMPGPQNSFHGIDPDGVRVDTPDERFRSDNPDTYPGWWTPGQVNRGIPYQWGGFSTLEEFDAGIRAGKFAGDISNAEKRRLLDSAVSRYCVGIDCSGFISRCWKLPRSFSTRELPGLCSIVPNWDSLQPGDILNTRNEHVILFEGWLDPQRSALIVYETGCPPTWKVFRRGLKRLPLLRYGYQAFRYKNVTD